MTRRTLAVVAAIAALLATALFSVLPARASHSRAVDPAAINPSSLKLPTGVLPPNSQVDHSAVSDNADAYGTTTPPDGFAAQFKLIHQKSYADLRRITGYRMDFSYHISGVPAGTEYLASIYPSADLATAAMDDATGASSLIAIIGHPLSACVVGDACKAFYGPVPGSTNTALLAVFREGPIVVETGTQVPQMTAEQFSALLPSLESALYSLLSAADVQIKAALAGNPPPPPATDTPTPAPPTATVTPSPTAMPTNTPLPPKKTCPKNSSRKQGKCTCKKGYSKKKGKCVKKKH